MTYNAAETSVVLLAAGRGKRMRELTESTPKPLLEVAGTSLIEHHCKELQKQGFRHIIINIDYHGEQIQNRLGNGSSYGLVINYSDESNTGALETAGGIRNALPIINSDPFLVVNADIFTVFPFAKMLKPLTTQGRLLMVKNPEHNPKGDFSLAADSKLLQAKASENGFNKNYTFSGIALYKKQIFASLRTGKQALAPIFKQLIAQQALEGDYYAGEWHDIGTPERLAEINTLHH